MTSRFAFVALACAVLGGCGDDDAGLPGGDAGRDATSGDSATGDAARDTGASDSAAADARPADSATADGGSDAAPIGPQCALFSACDPEDFVNMTGSSEITISFGGVLGTAYSPKCVAVTEGTVVTFSGDFGSHPLMQSCGPVDAIPGDASGDFSIMADTAGDFGYYCALHGSVDGTGMAGMIRVVAL